MAATQPLPRVLPVEQVPDRWRDDIELVHRGKVPGFEHVRFRTLAARAAAICLGRAQTMLAFTSAWICCFNFISDLDVPFWTRDRIPSGQDW